MFVLLDIQFATSFIKDISVTLSSICYDSMLSIFGCQSLLLPGEYVCKFFLLRRERMHLLAKCRFPFPFMNIGLFVLHGECKQGKRQTGIEHCLLSS